MSVMTRQGESPTLTRDVPMTHPSDSKVQCRIENEMLRIVGERNPEWRRVEDWSVLAQNLGLADFWQAVEPDAAWRTPDGNVIVAECYARLAKLKPGSERKLAMDALKLLAMLREADGRAVSARLVVAGEVASALKTGAGWFPRVVRGAIQIEEVDLDERTCRDLEEATARQRR